MKKNTTVKKNQRAQRNTKNRQARQMASKERLTIGLDSGRHDQPLLHFE